MLRVFTFEQRVIGGQILKDPKAAEINQWDPYFAWIQRALLGFLIRKLDLDFVLIETRRQGCGPPTGSQPG